MADDIKVVVKTEVQRALQQMGMLDDKVDDTQNSLGALSKKFSKFGSSMSKFVTLPILGAGAAALKFAGDIESQRVALTTMLGSAEDATDIMEEWQQFAAKTPFQLDDITQAGKALIAFGEDADDVTETLGRIGDVAAGLNIPMGELSEIYGKARVQGRLFAEDLNQLAGRGIPIFTELADVMGVTAGEVKQLTSEGQVGFEELEQAFINMTDEGGQFQDLMEAQSETMQGKLSTALDNLKMSAAQLGEVLLPMAKDVLDQITKMLQNFNDLDDSTKKFIVTAGGIAALIGPVSKLTGWVLKLANGIKAAGGISGLLKLGGAGGPVGLAITGTVAAGTAIAAATRKKDKERLNEYIEAQQKVVDHFKEQIAAGKTIRQTLSEIDEEYQAIAEHRLTEAEQYEEVLALQDEMIIKEHEIIAQSQEGMHYADMIDQAYNDQALTLEKQQELHNNILDQVTKRKKVENEITENQKIYLDALNAASNSITEGMIKDFGTITGLVNDLKGTVYIPKGEEGDKVMSAYPWLENPRKIDALLGLDMPVEQKLEAINSLLQQLQKSWRYMLLESNPANEDAIKDLEEVTDLLEEEQERLEKSQEAQRRFNEAMENRIPTQVKINDSIDEQNRMLYESEDMFARVHKVITPLNEELKAFDLTPVLPSAEETTNVVNLWESMESATDALKEMEQLKPELAAKLLEDLEKADVPKELKKVIEKILKEYDKLQDEMSEKIHDIQMTVVESSVQAGIAMAEAIGDGFTDGWEDVGQKMHDVVMDFTYSLLGELGPVGKIASGIMKLVETVGKKLNELIHPIATKARELTEIFTEELTSSFADALANGKNWEDAEKALDKMLKQMIVESLLEAIYFEERIKELSDQLADVFADGYDPAKDKEELERIKRQIGAAYEEAETLIDSVFEDVFDAEAELAEERINLTEEAIEKENELREKNLEKLERWADEELYQLRRALDMDLVSMDEYLRRLREMWDTYDESVEENQPLETNEVQSFARGGEFITNGKIPIMVGDNPGGREHVKITPLPSKDTSSGETVVIQINAPVYGIEDLEEKINKIAERKQVWRRRNTPQGVR